MKDAELQAIQLRLNVGIYEEGQLYVDARKLINEVYKMREQLHEINRAASRVLALIKEEERRREQEQREELLDGQEEGQHD